MRYHFIDEPELEFGGGGRHIDIRHGLAAHGPLDRSLVTAPKAIRVGVVGSAKDVESLREWVVRCRHGVEAKSSRLATLFVAFPGFGDAGPFCDFLVDDRLVDVISKADLDGIGGTSDAEFGSASSERFREGAAGLIEKANADVVVCLLPETFVRRIDVHGAPESGPRSRRHRQAHEQEVWHDVFKAQALTLSRPVQVARPATYGGGVHRFTRDGRAVQEIQDEATRAWNFYCALYYKAGGIPWRLVREPSDLTACFVGVSFYDDPTSETLRTSVAQIFNERGEGMVIRGGAAQVDERDRTPHLSAEEARRLLVLAVETYRREHRTAPARLVCHKSSYFTQDELEGCADAARDLRLDAEDLLSVRRSSIRLYRTGNYPPLRGTAVLHDGGCLLYTQGSVDFYRCYPGLYAPRTLDVKLDRTERGGLALMAEVLALTKLNWNSTHMVNLEPITVAAARGVGGILRHVPRDSSVQSRFSFFM